METFIDIFNSRINNDFKNTNIILFLNKYDLFKESIEKFKDFKNYFQSLKMMKNLLNV